MNEIYIFNIAKLAVKSILNVAAVYPKPGLTTPINSSALNDIDYPCLLDGTMSLFQCFVNCASIGAETEKLKPEETFTLLKAPYEIGKQDVMRATRGKLSLKGHVFLMGILCAAAGRLIIQKRNLTASALALTASSYARGIVSRELWELDENAKIDVLTAGQKAYVLYGIEGCRGEAEQGMQNILDAANFFKQLSFNEKILTLREKCVQMLLKSMSEIQDSCIAAYNGITELLKIKEEAGNLISIGGVLSDQGIDEIFKFDKNVRARGISPLGSELVVTCGLFITELERLKLTRSGMSEN